MNTHQIHLNTSVSYTGYLFDIYQFDHRIYIWILDDQHRLYLLSDTYYPVIYAEGSRALLRKLIQRLIELDALLEEPQPVFKKRFYSNSLIQVFKITISRPAVLWKIRNKLFALPDQLQIYHSENDIVAGYLREKNLYPLAHVQAITDAHKNILSIQSTQDLQSFEYTLPPLKILKIGFKNSHRLGFAYNNPLLIVCKSKEYVLEFKIAVNFLLKQLNAILIQEDPDVIISEHGDQKLFPYLFSLSQKNNQPLLLDRDQRTQTTRAIQRSGKSFWTYGSWIYRAPSYPLFGRWHIDSQNSFTYKETQLLGVIELARICQCPIQKVARASTGTILTQMEENLAVHKNYLIPWQKSTLECEKSWLHLHTHDKGGLVMKPNIRRGFVQENVFQLDFSQMYPSIMHLYNVSPETINCVCCEQGSMSSELSVSKQKKKESRVPYLHYRICSKRRGLVADTLQHVLQRRAYYKEKLLRSSGFEYEWTKIKINSLKWINVVSFGYLGFRNAKFGQLESHETVTAFGRQKMVQAMRIVERYDYQVVHGITDCLFIQKNQDSHTPNPLNPPDSPTPINENLIQHMKKICTRIKYWTRVKMDIEAIFDWVVFLPSQEDAKMPVSNKYFGKLHNQMQTKEKIKCRGLICRRKDMPSFIKQAQKKLLQIMEQGENIRAVQSLSPAMDDCYQQFDARLCSLPSAGTSKIFSDTVAPAKIAESSEIAWTDLLMRKTVSRKLEDYKVLNATSLALAQLQRRQIYVQPGEKIRYLVIDQANPFPEKRYLVEELAVLHPPTFYDVAFYRSLLWKAYFEIYHFFASEAYFSQIRPTSSQNIRELAL